MQIQIKKLHPDAVIPTQAKKYDAGYDLYALEHDHIWPLDRKLIKTGISIAVPEGYYARIAPRSGLALKNGIDVMAGVVDSSYRGEIGVVLVNLNSENAPQGMFQIKKGMKIAQLIIEKCHDVEWEEVTELPSSDRGAGGFGSTGA